MFERFACFALVFLCCLIPNAWCDVPATALVHADDYTFGYYPEGLRRNGDPGSVLYAIRTNQYSMLFDATRATVARLGAVHATDSSTQSILEKNAQQAAGESNDILGSLPKVELRFAVIWEGRVMPVVRGVGNQEQMQLYRVGKYLQHFVVPTVQLGGVNSGAGLEGVNAWVEGYGWPDRFTLEGHVAWYENHLGPAQEWKDIALAALLNVPPEYPVVEVLGPDGAWTATKQGERAETAIVMRNEAGEGVALVCIPGAGQQVRLAEEKGLALEAAPMTFKGPRQESLACVVVPSRDVRRDAAREFNAMQAAATGKLAIKAEGISPYTGPLPVEFEPGKGWWRVKLGENADSMTTERVRVSMISGADSGAPVRLNFAKAGGGFPITGMCPVLRDMDGYPIGVPMQISKNWHCAPSWFNGLGMLEMEPGATLDFEFDLAYAFWGGVPSVSHAQLCLMGWGGNQLWNQMAIGSFGESICYDPDVGLNRSMVDDMRPLMVWAMDSKPVRKWSWTNNVGGADFLTLFLKGNNQRQFLVRQKTLYEDYGPVLADVSFVGQTPGGAIESRIRTQSWRSDDYVRGLYTLRYDVVKPVANIERLAFFQLGADHYNDIRFEQIARGSAAGMEETWEPARGGLTYSRRGQPLSGAFPWVGMYKTAWVQRKEDDCGVLADKAFIVRKWKARLGGNDVPTPCYSVFGSKDGAIESAVVELSAPGELDRLEPGDYVETEVEMLILPQKADDYYGPNEALRGALTAHPEPWALTLREAVGSNVEVTAAAGSVEQAWPVHIRAADGNRAEFTILGGVGYTPISIAGLTGYRGFVLKKKTDDGSWAVVDQSSPVGRDWWQTKYDPPAATWELTFTIPLDAPGDTRRTTQTFLLSTEQ